MIVSLLNDYLDEMTNIMFDHGGTIDKVVGDAIHAIFGAPLSQPDHARRAVQCALDLDEFAQSFAEEMRTQGVALGQTRIGVNSEPAIVGNFGGETVFDYTAHGDAVNIAARVEAANKVLGTRVCVSKETVSRIPDFVGRPAGQILVKGKSDPIDVFEPLRAEVLESPDMQAYLAAYREMEGGADDAADAFAALAERCPDDSLAVLHSRRLKAGERGIRIATAERAV